ncbi:MAG: Na+/H+ antiporter NhaA [Acidimicrobiales bacterium]|nr:Na+/H+ antiporter NhaA [Actinomycetota bacterium]
MNKPEIAPGRSNSQAILEFVRTEAAGGIGLAAGALIALIWANTTTRFSYQAFWHRSLPGLRFGSLPVSTPQELVDNVAMTVFFLAIGLEVARERAEGSLRDLRDAILPVAGALGGMAGAAVVYLSVVTFAGNRSVLNGWGVPMATDVAFTLGALALLGTRIPSELRAFVLTLAVADDIASVVVLSIVSASKVNAFMILLAGAVLVVVFKVRRYFLRAWWLYVVASILEWVLLALGGVEPSLAGALVGMLVPVIAADSGDRELMPEGTDKNLAGPLLEAVVHPVSTYLILPIFALANTGVTLSSALWTDPRARDVAVGVLSARVLGKATGITFAVALMVKLRTGRLPENVRWSHILGAAVLCGMGFTVPLLFAIASFPHEPLVVNSAKIALIAGTLVTFTLGASVLIVIHAAHRRHDRVG